MVNLEKNHLFKKIKKRVKCLDYICKKISVWDLSKISQSGHTGSEENNPPSTVWFLKNGPSLFHLCSFFQTNITIFTANKCEKMSIQYTVLGYEPKTFGTWVSSHNHSLIYRYRTSCKRIVKSDMLCLFVKSYTSAAEWNRPKIYCRNSLARVLPMEWFDYIGDPLAFAVAEMEILNFSTSSTIGT